MTDFKDWLQGKMDERGLNAEQLAKRSGENRSKVRNWVAGANKPDWHSCRVLADVLALSKEEVRRRAGFVDPEDEAAPPIEDEEKAELDELWAHLDSDDRHMLLRLAALQFGSPRRQRRVAQPGR